jgi:thymidylate synthase
MLTLPEFASMDEALRASLDAVLRFGHVVSPRGMETREVLGWAFRLTQPRARKINLASRRWSETLAIGELCWHLSGSDDVSFISYYSPVWASFSEDGHRIRGSCYGKRIFSPGEEPPSQWDLVKETLKECPESRRAMLTLYETGRDLRPSAPDLPCLATVQFLLRKGRLHCIATMRSNDVIWGLCYDAFFITMLQELLATELGVRLGWFQHTANSLHIYKPFYEMAHEIVDEKSLVSPKPMPRMRAIECLPAFLSAEAELRRGDSAGLKTVQTLPPYWRQLAQPLVGRYLRRNQAPPRKYDPTDVVKPSCKRPPMPNRRQALFGAILNRL